MKPTPVALLLASLATTALGQAGGAPKVENPDKPAKLVLHEWGTFTSFAGPNGDITPFQITIGDNLPDFVQGRIFGEGWTSVRNVPTGKFALVSEQRMETPVIYFYTDKPAELSVSVTMPDGLITEVYPPVTSAAPDSIQAAIPAAGSSVRWDHIGIVPSYCCDTISLPQGGESHYFQARATKANILSVTKGPETFGERFLFYRGVARGDFGLKAKALGNDRFVIDQSKDGPLSAVFAVEVAGAQVRFSEAHDVKPGDQLSLPKDATTAEALGAAMAASLVKAGLYDDEAKAMVATWKHLWFGESGTRVMVIMPQTAIDKALQLTVSPTPTEVKRVFVARLEMLTPERLKWAQDLVNRAATIGEDDATISAELGTLGRFQYPATQLAKRCFQDRWTEPGSKPN
jgi:hypothetical protein